MNNLTFTGFSDTHPATPSTIDFNVSSSTAGFPGPNNPRTEHSGSILHTTGPMQPNVMNMGPIDRDNEGDLHAEPSYEPNFYSAFEEYERRKGYVTINTDTNQQIWDKNIQEAKESLVYREVAQAAVNNTEKSVEALENTFKTRINAGDFGDTKQANNSELVGRFMFEGVICIMMSLGILFLRVVASNSRMLNWTEIAGHALNVQRENLENKRREIKRDENHAPPNVVYYHTENFRMTEKYTFHLKIIHLKRYVRSIVSPNYNPLTPTYIPKDWNIYQILREEIQELTDTLNNPEEIEVLKAHIASFEALSTSRIYKEFEWDQDELRRIINEYYATSYNQAEQEHIQHKYKLNQLRIEEAKLKNEVDGITKFSVMINALTTGISLMATKLKHAVEKFPEIVNKMNQTVILTIGGRDVVIKNPYVECSLTGMIQVLRNEYMKLNLVTFKSKLMEIMNTKLLRNQMDNPEYGMNMISQYYNAWNSQGMGKYFTPDMFWTVNFLRQYDQDCELYNECLERVLYFIHSQSTELIVHHGLTDVGMLYPGMPIFSDLMTWLKQYYMPKIRDRQPGFGVKHYNNQRSKQSNNTNNNQSHQANNGQQRQQQSTLQSSQWGYAAITNDINTAKKAEGYFNKEIKREDNLYIMIPDRRNPGQPKKVYYTATKECCQACKNLSVPSEHNPRCYTKSQCVRCSWYGHNDKDCKQKL